MKPVNPVNLVNPEHDLQRLLAIEPSPEFVTRVRMRIANEPAGSPWQQPRAFVALGAMAAVLAAAVFVSRSQEQQPSRSADVRLPAEYRAAVPEKNADPLVTPAIRPPVARAAAPDILVSQAEMKGLRRLIALANEGDTGLESLLSATLDPEPLPDINTEQIVIAPLVIEPLASDTY